MNFAFENTTSILLVLVTGLSAGLCFTWLNAVTPGIGNLDNQGYLNAFQQMNRTIINPMFFIVFFGPFFLSLITLYVNRNTSNTILWLLIIATLIYFIGVLLVTIFGNEPLNEILENTNLASATIEELDTLRKTFEVKWNQFHLIRTITSIVSFLLIIITLSLTTKNSI